MCLPVDEQCVGTDKKKTTIDIKINMRHIHTSMVSRHLATRDNNKILCTPPQHIDSSEEILPCLTRHTLAQFRTNKLKPFLKSYLHIVDDKPHPSSWCIVAQAQRLSLVNLAYGSSSSELTEPTMLEYQVV